MTTLAYVDKSPIHGKGLFAQKRIKKGECIGTYEGKRTRSDGMHVLWVEETDGKWIGIKGENELKYLNHSSKPNAEFDGDELFAIRAIKKGEEITFDYGEEWEDVE
ncbi:MAG: SET domain-containing protein-lysine N-methyltransferase [Planctomycetota bacterium]